MMSSFVCSGSILLDPPRCVDCHLRVQGAEHGLPSALEIPLGTRVLASHLHQRLFRPHQFPIPQRQSLSIGNEGGQVAVPRQWHSCILDLAAPDAHRSPYTPIRALCSDLLQDHVELFKRLLCPLFPLCGFCHVLCFPFPRASLLCESCRHH